MRIIFTKNSWEDYVSWQREDKKLLKRINLLLLVFKERRLRVLAIPNLQNVIYRAIGHGESIGNFGWSIK